MTVRSRSGSVAPAAYADPVDSEPRTLSDIDTSRPLRTDDELLRLIAAIHGSRPEVQETSWLEWKSSLDLTKAAGRFTVAKAVLGFANRSVDDAQLTTGGVAYMVVGVEPGAAPGVAAIDHADLTPWIKIYASTPRFTPRTLRYAGVEVLVIVVEPPEAGDPLHTLRKQYDKFDAGVIFNRGSARTAPASPGDIEMLSDRLLQGARQPDLDLKLRCTADPLYRLNIGREQVQEWLSRHEAYVRATSGEPPAPVPTPAEPSMTGLSLSSLFADNIGLGALDRSNAAEFDQRVETYLAKLGRVLTSHVLREIVRDEDANTVRFQVGNDTPDPVSGVQLTVRVPKNRVLVYTTSPRTGDWPEKPKWPDPLDQFRPQSAAWFRSSVEDLVPIQSRSGSVTELDDSFEVTWDIGDLHPDLWSRELDITVIAAAATPEQLDVEIVARSMSRRGIVARTETLTVSADELTIDDFFTADPE
ncbi:hypothetical protein A5772_13660 [Mycolicibacter sinensis]|uniref:Schlafen AlbA-2 domain-containing protein n=1 Tax=Mycolicibacter sinensis (strain JDM601) TaxID=875328 RepID=A0A1A2E0H3_MYCSD|nr:hypothetical protein A5772_13660 [Mycolicibacter sinensis]OBG01011.1 hypothetical protein A5771_17815 [Mycolicibacter sinensis]